MAATLIVVFTTRVLIPPDGIAKIERARIGDGARGGTGGTADQCACASVAGERADHRACAGAKQAAGHRAITRRSAASRKSKCSGCSKKHHAFHCVTFHG